MPKRRSDGTLVCGGVAARTVRRERVDDTAEGHRTEPVLGVLSACRGGLLLSLAAAKRTFLDLERANHERTTTVVGSVGDLAV